MSPRTQSCVDAAGTTASVTSEPSLCLGVLTLDGGPSLRRTLASAATYVDEIVVLVDNRTTDDSRDVARASGARVLDVDNPYGYLEPFVERMVAESRAGWVLRLDDDEILSVGFSLGAVLDVAGRDIDMIGIPRAWALSREPPTFRGMGRHPRELKPQYRLLRREAPWRFTDRIHTPGVEMRRWIEVGSALIGHMTLLDDSVEERQRRFDFYESFGSKPWNHDYLLDAGSRRATECSWPLPTPPGLTCFDPPLMAAPIRVAEGLRFEATSLGTR